MNGETLFSFFHFFFFLQFELDEFRWTNVFIFIELPGDMGNAKKKT